MAREMRPIPVTKMVYIGFLTKRSQFKHRMICPVDSQTRGDKTSILGRGGCVRDRKKKAHVTQHRTTKPTVHQQLPVSRVSRRLTYTHAPAEADSWEEVP